MRESTSQVDIEEYINKFHSTKPDEIAHAILYLIGDSSMYVNSQILTIDGGRKF